MDMGSPDDIDWFIILSSAIEKWFLIPKFVLDQGIGRRELWSWFIAEGKLEKGIFRSMLMMRDICKVILVGEVSELAARLDKAASSAGKLGERARADSNHLL